MKILFVLDNYWPFKGGAETLFRNLAEGLVKKGNTVTILTRRITSTKSYEELNGVKIHRISTASRYLFTFLAIPKAISLAKQADIIHTTTFNSAFPAWIAAKASGKPCVITIHEMWLGKWDKYTDMGKINAALHTLLERPIYSLTFNKYICVSNSTRQQLMSLGKPPEKTETIYNGLDYSHFNPKNHNGMAIRKKLGLDKKFVCLTYGRAGPSKGMEYAAEAASIVDIKNYKHIFIIAKDYGKNHQKFMKAAKSKNILLLEPKPYSELPAYLAAADCIVIPSLSEGFGYTAAEACAMGKPVVATNTTSLPEIVSGKFVLVAPKNPQAIAEGIAKVYRKKYTRTPLKKFTIEANVQAHFKLYNELTARLK